MIKKGIKVKILAGKDKKKEGEIIEIDRRNNKAKVKGINIVKKHIKTTKACKNNKRKKRRNSFKRKFFRYFKFINSKWEKRK